MQKETGGFWCFRVWVATAWCAVVLGAGWSCGDDTLGQRFQADELPEEESGPVSPITVGTELWYTLITSFKRTSESDAGGLTQGEAQAVGQICSRVVAVRDTASPFFANEEQTTILADVKVSGQVGSTNMDYSDQENSAATGPEVDAMLNGLWLKRLTMPSADHGFANPKELEFSTRVPPWPDLVGFESVLFFETRELPGDGWSGWRRLSGEFEGADSFTGELMERFRGPPLNYDNDALSDATRFRIEIATPPPSCAEYNDPTTCSNNHCTWAGRTGAANSCLRLYRVAASFLETIDSPVEHAGEVLHFLELSYTEDGVLFEAREDIRPNNSPLGTRLSADFPNNPCAERCQSADLALHGGFTDDPAYPAPCSFTGAEADAAQNAAALGQ